MSENNLNDLSLEWKNFKYYQDIEKDEIDKIWKCFNKYKLKILDGTLQLDDYTNRVNSLDSECNYLCQFFERDSSKYFAAAKPGNANNYGIKRNDDETYYCSKKLTTNKELLRVNKEEANKFFPKILKELNDILKEEITDENIETKSKLFENSILPNKLILKMIAMNNNGKFLYTYKTEVLKNIYYFLYKEENSKLSDFELSYYVTKKAKELFENSNNGKWDIYLIKLSSFLWQFFQEKQLDNIDKNTNIEQGNPKMPNNTKQKQPLNQILYGSPGTGKTYNTINKALEIIFSQDKECGRTHEDLDKKFDINQNKKDDKCQYETIKKSYKEAFDQDDRNALKQIFEYYKEQGQIQFVTFHQSYGYEEFVEGIKAETNGENITYEVKAGIFKKLSNRANKNIEQSKENIIIKKEFDVVFKEKILDKLLDNDKLEIKMKKSSFYIKEVDETHISFDKTGGESQHVLLIKNLKLMYEQGENKIIMGGLSQYYNPLLEYLFENSEIKNEEKEPLKNYILIIDEINRGNISKIFGELITLIEDSKRLDKPEQIEITLPYSGQKFGVPKNLYIIGTMNTADRSIAPIDTALRRRFVFEEMAPNPSLLSKEKTPDIYDGVNLQSLLEAINTRIEYLYDRDHTIGHAYLIDVETLDDLKFAFKNKIIPLLAEYFYEDWENIDLVLNSNGFIESKKDDEKYLSKKIQDRIRNKTTYKVSDDSTWTKEHFINIYNKNENE